MPATWSEDAISWIRKAAANLPAHPPDRWQVAQPTAEAEEAAVRVIKALGPDAPRPSNLLVTLDQGIELEWRHGNRLLSIEVLANGTVESLECVGGEPFREEEPEDRHLRRLVAWVQG